MRLLLDTVVLIYAVESPERLSKRAASAVESPANILELSSISIAEIAIKSSLGKLELSESSLRQALIDLDVRVLPYSGEHALRMFELPNHHRDPFDQQLIAQALSENIPIVTSDEAFERYKGLRVIW
ncbi:MAG TPA: type II toxin-antitoxin system VapC family toxin [Terriglobales bacterium]